MFGLSVTLPSNTLSNIYILKLRKKDKFCIYGFNKINCSYIHVLFKNVKLLNINKTYKNQSQPLKIRSHLDNNLELFIPLPHII